MILILGGTKSGKSSHASRLAETREDLGPVMYLATAQAGDEEMRQRIKRHRSDRPEGWITVEEPMNPASVFHRLAGGSDVSKDLAASTVLVDCLTLWLTNIISPLGDEPSREEALALGEAEGQRLLKAVSAWEAGAQTGGRQAILVSNQVEVGLVSPWPLGRVFQDLAGLTHQRIAAEAAEVYLMSAGLAQQLK